jgi:DUF1009 family protein
MAVRSVWVLARPLSVALSFPLILADSSAGKYSMNHWAVMITELKKNNVTQIFHCRRSDIDIVKLGALIELFRDQDRNNVKINTEFSTTDLRRDWPLAYLSFTYIGTTIHSDDEIQSKGMPYSPARLMY